MLAPPFFARRVLSQWTLVRAAFLFVVVLFVTYSGFLFTSGGDMPSMTDLQEAWAVGSDALGAYTEWVPWVGGASPEDEPIAICAAIKDESKDMVEWLVHHYHHMGIKRFYIMEQVLLAVPILKQELTCHDKIVTARSLPYRRLSIPACLVRR